MVKIIMDRKRDHDLFATDRRVGGLKLNEEVLEGLELYRFGQSETVRGAEAQTVHDP